MTTQRKCYSANWQKNARSERGMYGKLERYTKRLLRNTARLFRTSGKAGTDTKQVMYRTAPHSRDHEIPSGTEGAPARITAPWESGKGLGCRNGTRIKIKNSHTRPEIHIQPNRKARPEKHAIKPKGDSMETIIEHESANIRIIEMIIRLSPNDIAIMLLALCAIIALLLLCSIDD